MKDIVFLGCVVKALHSLSILQDCILTLGVWVDSGACEDIVFMKHACRCPTELDLIDIINVVYAAKTFGESLSSELVKQIEPPLVTLICV